MPDSPPNAAQDVPPWERKHPPGGKHRARKAVPWLIGLALAGWILWGLWPKPIPVETQAVARRPLTVFVTEEGKTRIRNRFTVAAPVAGSMRRVTLKAGDPVNAGKTVLMIVDGSAPALLDSRSRAQAEARVALHEAAVQRANESAHAARAALATSEADRDRTRSLSQPGSVSESDRDRIEGEARIRAAELRAAEFAVKIAEYELQQARDALRTPAPAGDPVIVTSPIDGKVLRVVLESQTTVAPGTVVMEIGDPADLEVEAEMLSRDAVAMREGDPATIGQWGGEEALKARVRRIEPAAFTKVSALGVEEQRVIVLCDITDRSAAAERLGDRFRVEVKVAVWESSNTLTAPAGALFREGNEWKTFVMSQGRARLTTINAGRSDGRFTEILAGLAEGDEVLVHPPDTVSDSTRVRHR
jgi:HlyD family secretion protein